MEGEVGVGGAKPGDEVVLKGADGAFGGVAAVDPGRSKLEVDALLGHVGLKDGGGFVVKFLELGAKAVGTEEVGGTLVGSEDGDGGA